ncbi:MAG: metal ABC transporter permease [Actinomycetota bacterium]|nr:metal ABC transporter permease [Actinomycetota bacterium]
MTGLVADAGAHLRWDVVADIQQVLAYHFMVNALRSATITAVVAGITGWFMVLRRQTFVGHTLSVVSFPGAAGALVAGVATGWGYFGLCVAAAMVISAIPYSADRRGFSAESAVVGVIQAFALGCGFLFAHLYHGFLSSTLDNLLFGTLLGVTDDQVWALAAVAVTAVAALTVIGRPLLFSSVDPAVAAARGVPVRVVSAVFLVVLAMAVAEISQITGALLVFALLVMPAAAAQQLTIRPSRGLALSVVIGVVVAWLGVGVSYFSSYPTGFFLTSFGFIAYTGAVASNRVRAALGRRPTAPPPVPITSVAR